MITNTSGAAILNDVFGKTPMAAPSTWYFGLCSLAAIDGTYTEATGGSYARVAVANDKTSFSDATSTPSLINDIAIEFPESTASWGTLNYVCVFSASSAGTMWFFDTLSPAISVATNTTVRFAAGGVNATMTN